MLKYRDATLQDLKIIVEIYNSTIPLRKVTADTELVTVESKQKWFEEHHPSHRPLWIVENQQEEIIGWVSFSSFHGRPAYNATAEIGIYLDVAYRNKGFGKEILQHCIKSAPAFGIKTLLGFIFSHNLPSLQLFRNLEFQDWALLPNVAELDGEEKGLIIVGKRVA